MGSMDLMRHMDQMELTECIIRWIRWTRSARLMRWVITTWRSCGVDGWRGSDV